MECSYASRLCLFDRRMLQQPQHIDSTYMLQLKTLCCTASLLQNVKMTDVPYDSLHIAHLYLNQY